MSYKITFRYENDTISFQGETIKSTIGKCIDWLYTNGYSFEGVIHSAFTRRPVSMVEIKTKSDGYYLKQFRLFHRIKGTDKYLWIGGNVKPAGEFIVKMLENFGIGKTTIKLEGFNTTSDLIKKFSEIKQEEEETQEETLSYTENPFKQSICVLGESGTGKSVTVENVLEYEEHEYEFIIPTAATTGLLSQFSPSKSGYVPSRLGNMILAAAQNPETCYTAVFDEMHKSNVIEMINDELLQCISTKRNNGNRFISLDEDTAELYNIPELERKRGNIYLPDNFGFIFISSKPRVISNNPDFFNRVDIVVLNSYEEETIETAEELLSKVLDEDEKAELKSTRND